jgi:hypothetical protein
MIPNATSPLRHIRSRISLVFKKNARSDRKSGAGARWGWKERVIMTLKCARNTLLWGCLGMSLTSAIYADAAEAKQRDVRIQAVGLGSSGWLRASFIQGQFIQGQGCSMLKLDQKSPGGYTSLLLAAVSRLQTYNAGQWTEVGVGPLLKKEPKHCLEGGSD